MNHNETVPLSPFPLAETGSSGATKEELYAVFIGNKYQRYYQEKFQGLEAVKSKGGFNISAFFLGPIWLFYRKMYVYGSIYFGFIILTGIMTTMFNVAESVDRGISMGLAVAMGLGGNGLYNFFIDKKINSPNITITEVKKRGGTNSIAACLVLLMVVALVSLGIYLEV
ncbi:DUF2628 domain-containing protein [Acinetobacter sp. ANC 4648]|uniref:DUF2628 domain-containing protein n=1 Tax=Acinetobacter sp. ANC 4648 TaxID=1977875 RepID=UPI000A33B2CA|nr:DUF2628 domain-containing protein [Acinetobacter sp. ANC 4648]OTG80632.1 hypothetical protein B9T27_12195 [Acinetobacter sp. ANC 4648]